MKATKALLSLSLLLSLAPVFGGEAIASSSAGPAGRPGGSDYSAQCGSGRLIGLNVYTGWFVDSVQMICDNGFGGTQAEGPHFGGAGGGLRKLQCDDGYVVTGIHGRDGDYVDRIGITCSHSEDPSFSYNVGSVGGNGGSYFSFACPSGSYASGIFGSSGALVDELGLHCKASDRDQSCDPWANECGMGQYCQLSPEEQCGDGWVEGTCTSTQVVCPAVYTPVCGCDGETYSNRCYAQQAGQNVWRDGEC